MNKTWQDQLALWRPWRHLSQNWRMWFLSAKQKKPHGLNGLFVSKLLFHFFSSKFFFKCSSTMDPLAPSMILRSQQIQEEVFGLLLARDDVKSSLELAEEPFFKTTFFLLTLKKPSPNFPKHLPPKHPKMLNARKGKWRRLPLPSLPSSKTSWARPNAQWSHRLKARRNGLEWQRSGATALDFFLQMVSTSVVVVFFNPTNHLNFVCYIFFGHKNMTPKKWTSGPSPTSCPVFIRFSKAFAFPPRPHWGPGWRNAPAPPRRTASRRRSAGAPGRGAWSRRSSRWRTRCPCFGAWICLRPAMTKRSWDILGWMLVNWRVNIVNCSDSEEL